MKEITPTMKSTDFHEIIFANASKYTELKAFHRKIRDVLEIQPDGEGLSFKPTLRANGRVECYNLDEIECHIIMASVDVEHFETAVTIFIEARNAAFKPKTRLELAREQVVLLEKLEATEKTK
jgi:hypothetical protein